MRREFTDASVETAYERGWATLQNGALLAAADDAGFDVFVTTDKNLQYQQRAARRRLAILVLWTTSWPELQAHTAIIVDAAKQLSAGGFRELMRP